MNKKVMMNKEKKERKGPTRRPYDPSTAERRFRRKNKIGKEDRKRAAESCTETRT